MFTIRADAEKNRLYVTIGILESRGEILDLLKEAEKIASQLSPGFTCVTDLRQYRRVGDSGEEIISQVQRYLKEAGLVRAVRIERRQALPEHVQFETGSLEAGYRTDLVRSLEEAESLLDALKPQA